SQRGARAGGASRCLVPRCGPRLTARSTPRRPVLSSASGDRVKRQRKGPPIGPRRSDASPRPVVRKAPAPPPPAKVVVDRQGPLPAEIVVVGRELLRGQVGDRSAPWIAGELTRRGAIVHRITVVDDLERSVAHVVGEARERGVHLIVTTGGLGPAQDDRTL